MISASKSTLSLNNLKIVRPKVMKFFTNLRTKFCEYPPSNVAWTSCAMLLAVLIRWLKLDRQVDGNLRWVATVVFDLRLLHAVAFSKKLPRFEPTKVISLKTQPHAVNVCVKCSSQRSFTFQMGFAVVDH